jgi:hypothetical protein
MGIVKIGCEFIGLVNRHSRARARRVRVAWIVRAAWKVGPLIRGCGVDRISRIKRIIREVGKKIRIRRNVRVGPVKTRLAPIIIPAAWRLCAWPKVINPQGPG